jgi:hypothetical protein
MGEQMREQMRHLSLARISHCISDIRTEDTMSTKSHPIYLGGNINVSGNPDWRDALRDRGLDPDRHRCITWHGPRPAAPQHLWLAHRPERFLVSLSCRVLASEGVAKAGASVCG